MRTSEIIAGLEVSQVVNGRKILGRFFCLRLLGRAVWCCVTRCEECSLVTVSRVGNVKRTVCHCQRPWGKTSRRESKHYEGYNHLRHRWKSMKKRCSNPNAHNYKYYGARGIQVCEEWSSFAGFIDWVRASNYEPGLTIDRIDNDGPYSPDNCRWVTWSEQRKNQRRNTVSPVGDG